MMGINKVILVGNLGGDPEVRKTASDQSITLFNLATSKTWTNREGQRQESTDWHRIVVWGKLGETCANYLSKGRQVYVEGRIQTRSWEDAKGEKRYTTEVIAHQVLFLGSPQSQSDSARPSSPQQQSTEKSYQNEPPFEAGGGNAASSSSSSAGAAAGGAKDQDIPF